MRDDRGPPRGPPTRDARDDRGPPRGRDAPSRERDRDNGDNDAGDAAGDRGEGVWFRINVGRNKNADPKWLVPMLCRRGGVQKRDLGRFKIGRMDTMFEINPSKARSFEQSARAPDAKDPNIKIERADREQL